MSIFMLSVTVYAQGVKNKMYILSHYSDGKPYEERDGKTGLGFQTYYLFYSQEGVDFLILIKGTNISDATKRGMLSQADWVQEGKKISWNWYVGPEKGTGKGWGRYDEDTKILMLGSGGLYFKEIGPIPKSK